MKSTISIQVKAAILLLVFGLNTIVGFACAVGVDMGFNATHHHGEEASEVHIHKDGKKHHHAKGTHDHDQKHEDQKGNCCNDSVIKLSQIDKAVPQSNFLINPVFITSFVSSFYTFDILYSSQTTTNVKYFVRGHHPPIPDVRIAIQSFQI